MYSVPPFDFFLKKAVMVFLAVGLALNNSVRINHHINRKVLNSAKDIVLKYYKPNFKLVWKNVSKCFSLL